MGRPATDKDLRGRESGKYLRKMFILIIKAVADAYRDETQYSSYHSSLPRERLKFYVWQTLVHNDFMGIGELMNVTPRDDLFRSPEFKCVESQLLVYGYIDKTVFPERFSLTRVGNDLSVRIKNDYPHELAKLENIITYTIKEGGCYLCRGLVKTI